MKVEYKGHKILRGLDGVDMRHLRPAAIITGKHEEKQLIDKHCQERLCRMRIRR